MSNMSTPVTKPSSADSHCLVMSKELDPHSKSKTSGKSLCVVSRVKDIGQNNVLDQLTTDQVQCSNLQQDSGSVQ